VGEWVSGVARRRWGRESVPRSVLGLTSDRLMTLAWSILKLVASDRIRIQLLDTFFP
jgi:hypothetical protein